MLEKEGCFKDEKIGMFMENTCKAKLPIPFKEKKIGDASSDSSDSDVSSYNSLSKVLYVVEEESKESGSMVSKKFDKLQSQQPKRGIIQNMNYHGIQLSYENQNPSPQVLQEEQK